MAWKKQAPYKAIIRISKILPGLEQDTICAVLDTVWSDASWFCRELIKQFAKKRRLEIAIKPEKNAIKDYIVNYYIKNSNYKISIKYLANSVYSIFNIRLPRNTLVKYRRHAYYTIRKKRDVSTGVTNTGETHE